MPALPVIITTKLALLKPAAIKLGIRTYLGGDSDMETLDEIRSLEPLSRVMKSFGVPPPETVIPTPREIISRMGLPVIDEELPKIQEMIRSEFFK
jgi:hypothetical protein